MSKCQSQLTVSVVFAASLEGPWSNPHVHAKSRTQWLVWTVAHCLPNLSLPMQGYHYHATKF